MPKYRVPAESIEISPEKPAKKSKPAVYLPANEAIVNALDVGKGVRLVIVGRLRSATIAKGKSYPRTEIQVELDSIEAYPKDSQAAEVDQMLDED